MGVVYVDSFDFYSTSNIALKWPHSYLTQYAISSAAARTGSGGVSFTTNASGLYGYISSPAIANTTTMIAGFAIKIVTMPTGATGGSNATNNQVLFFGDNGSSGYHDSVVGITLDGGGYLRMRNSSGAISDNWTGPSPLVAGQWYYVEVKATWGTAVSGTGSIEIRVDYLDGKGSQVVNQSVGTTITAVSGASAFAIIGMGSPFGSASTFPVNSTAFYIDDIYVLDPTTGVNTTYLGACSVNCMEPAGAGSSTQFAPSQAGVANYVEVSEATFDSDTTYVSTSGVGNRDSYTLGTMPDTPKQIFAVHVSSFDRVDAGETTRTMNNSLRIGGVYYDGAASGNLNATYAPVRSVWENNPATNSYFSRSDVEGMEAGVKLVS